MKQTGFTLIELIIVLAIFGIIASIAGQFLFGTTSAKNLMVQNGTICEPIQPGSKEGLAFSVSQGYRQQIVGTNGLPVGCVVE